MSASVFVSLLSLGAQGALYLQAQVELAVLALLNRADAGSDVGLELVEAEGDDLWGAEVSAW